LLIRKQGNSPSQPFKLFSTQEVQTQKKKLVFGFLSSVGFAIYRTQNLCFLYWLRQPGLFITWAKCHNPYCLVCLYRVFSRWVLLRKISQWLIGFIYCLLALARGYLIDFSVRS